VKTPPELYVIQEPEAPAPRNVIHISGIRSHGAADVRRVERPWPRQRSFREMMRHPSRNKPTK